MTVLLLSELTFNNKNILKSLCQYLNKVESYRNFDTRQKVRIYSDSSGDFTAFESVRYNLGFTSVVHKISDTINSEYIPIEIDYHSFKLYLDTICPS